MDVTIESTLRAASGGDSQAWRSLVEQYTGRVYGLIVRQCRDRELAEEITQATFVRLVHKLGDYQEQGRFEPWLFRMASNLLRDEMRRRKRQAQPTDFTETPPQALGLAGHHDPPNQAPDHRLLRDEQNAALHEAVANLNEADRQIIELRYTAEMGFQEIAALLEQPIGTVLARAHRALKKLKTQLEFDESKR